MKKYFYRVAAIFLAIPILCMCLFGCNEEKQEKDRLPVPEVAIGYDGLAVWGQVEGAIYYIYVLDGEEEHLTAEYSLQLSDGQSFSVKAVSGLEDYADSEFSVPQVYTMGDITPHDHVDPNADGTCDICGESVLVELSFYAVNDLHGKYKDSSSQPGLDEFTTYLKQLYADPVREEILLSSGDMWQGSVESSSNKGRLMTKWMNEVNFSSMTLGNHEYDWGAAVLQPNSELAEFPFLAINVTDGGAAPSYCKTSTIVERAGVKVGIIGAIGDCLSSISGEFSGGLSFATGDALTALVKREAARLREEEGCDLIVYSLHDGGSGYSSGISEVTSEKLSVQDGNSSYDYYDTALSDGYIDLVFEGHTHQKYIVKDRFGVYHLQGGGENSGVSRAEVSYNTVTGDYTVSPTILTTYTYAANSLEDDPFVEENYRSFFPDAEDDPYTKVLGNSSARRSSDTIVQKVAELYLARGKAEWLGKTVGGVTIDSIVLGGGYLNTRKPYELSEGSIHYAELYSILPFDNHIVLGAISGSNLKRRFLQSSSYVFSAEISASQVQDSKTYYIITDTYTSFYRWNNVTEIARIEEDIYARDLLADFIRGGGWAS